MKKNNLFLFDKKLRADDSILIGTDEAGRCCCCCRVF